MGSRQRYVVVGILILAVLAGVSMSHGFAWLWAAAEWDDMPIVSRELTLTSLLGYGLAAAGAIFVLKYPRVFQLANEVVDELSKVTWPTREETSNATVVVIVTVVVCSAYLGVFDAMWLWLTDWILGVPGVTPS